MVCISNIDYDGFLCNYITVNKVYECKWYRTILFDRFALTCDDGIYRLFPKKCFITLEEYKKQLVKERFEQI